MCNFKSFSKKKKKFKKKQLILTFYLTHYTKNSIISLIYKTEIFIFFLCTSSKPGVYFTDTSQFGVPTFQGPNTRLKLNCMERLACSFALCIYLQAKTETLYSTITKLFLSFSFQSVFIQGKVIIEKYLKLFASAVADSANNPHLRFLSVQLHNLKSTICFKQIISKRYSIHLF